MMSLPKVSPSLGPYQYLLAQFLTLESGDIEEAPFYTIIEKADNEYWKLNGKLGELLEDYFVMIHTEIIEVVED